MVPNGTDKDALRPLGPAVDRHHHAAIDGLAQPPR